MAKSTEVKPEKAALFTPSKIAEIYGVSPAKIKKAIEQLALKPDEVKGKCNYYTEASAKKIQKAIG